MIALNRFERFLTRRNIFIAALLLALTFCSLWVLVDQTIVSHEEVFGAESLINKTLIESTAIKLLREKQHKQEEDLKFLTQQEQEEAAQLQRDLADVVANRAKLEAERETMRRDQQTQRSDLETKIQQLRIEQVAFDEQRAHFDRDQKLLEEQRNDLIESVQRLQRQNAELALISERLKQSNVFESLGPAAAESNDFVQKLRPHSENSINSKNNNNNNNSGMAIKQPQQLNAEFDPLESQAQLSMAAEQLNKTVSKLVEEKATLTSKLHLLADALKTFDVQKELHCDNEVDRNRVHPSLTPAEIERDWRACWQKPFLTLIGSYHCDSTWRQVLSGASVRRVDVVDSPETNNGLIMLTLGTGEVSLFKPCGHGALSEAAAYHLDRLVGFQRTPAAVTRAWPVPLLMRTIGGQFGDAYDRVNADNSDSGGGATTANKSTHRSKHANSTTIVVDTTTNATATTTVATPFPEKIVHEDAVETISRSKPSKKLNNNNNNSTTIPNNNNNNNNHTNVNNNNKRSINSVEEHEHRLNLLRQRNTNARKHDHHHNNAVKVARPQPAGEKISLAQQLLKVEEMCGTRHNFIVGTSVGWAAERLESLSLSLPSLIALWFGEVPQLVHNSVVSKADLVNNQVLLPRRLELIRYAMWCFLLNDFTRSLYMFKPEKRFLIEGGLIVYLDNDGADWRDNALLRIDTQSLPSTVSKPGYCSRKSNSIDCSQFDKPLNNNNNNNKLINSTNNSANNNTVTISDVGERIARFIATACMFERGLATRLRAFVAAPHRLSPSVLMAQSLQVLEARVFWLRLRIDAALRKKMSAYHKDAITVNVLKYDDARQQFATIFPILCAAFPDERFGYDDDQPLPDVNTLSRSQLEDLIDSCSGFYVKENCLWLIARNSLTRRPLGVAMVSPSVNSMYLANLGVLPEERGNGVATILMRVVQSEAAVRGLKNIVGSVTAGTSDSAKLLKIYCEHFGAVVDTKSSISNTEPTSYKIVRSFESEELIRAMYVLGRSGDDLIDDIQRGEYKGLVHPSKTKRATPIVIYGVALAMGACLGLLFAGMFLRGKPTSENTTPSSTSAVPESVLESNK